MISVEIRIRMYKELTPIGWLPLTVRHMCLGGYGFSEGASPSGRQGKLIVVGGAIQLMIVCLLAHAIPGG
jgi:hypothetical protein